MYLVDFFLICKKSFLRYNLNYTRLLDIVIETQRPLTAIRYRPIPRCLLLGLLGTTAIVQRPSLGVGVALLILCGVLGPHTDSLLLQSEWPNIVIDYEE